ncbi:hypothetical protein TBC1_12482 [Lentimicrobium saccharophilum]|uniref:Uncharacterized protein n=1 Tax=Lentimicrobium saccharophilum TaxID=1678841 RepID=A0A0S7C6V6_9BACT|nr:hypothetical protein [Lentimicrobium saccharophilum]GAP44671.1 hypothetical protein TBC1_12482 [Lentimicrobium saccharophilum]
MEWKWIRLKDVHPDIEGQWSEQVVIDYLTNGRMYIQQVKDQAKRSKGRIDEYMEGICKLILFYDNHRAYLKPFTKYEHDYLKGTVKYWHDAVGMRIPLLQLDSLHAQRMISAYIDTLIKQGAIIPYPENLANTEQREAYYKQISDANIYLIAMSKAGRKKDWEIQERNKMIIEILNHIDIEDYARFLSECFYSAGWGHIEPDAIRKVKEPNRN